MEGFLNESDAVIRDGMSQSGYIEALAGVHGELRFSYRPMLAEDVEAFEVYRDRHGTTDPKGTTVEMSRLLADHLVSWSVSEDGRPVPVSMDNVRRLRYRLLGRVYQIVAGLSGSDRDGQAAILGGPAGAPVSATDVLGKL